METGILPGFSELLRLLSEKATTDHLWATFPERSLCFTDGVICTTCPASEKALSAGVRSKQSH